MEQNQRVTLSAYREHSLDLMIHIVRQEQPFQLSKPPSCVTAYAVEFEKRMPTVGAEFLYFGEPGRRLHRLIIIC